MSSDVKKKSPNIDLRGAVGNYLVGVFKRRFESKQYPGVYSSLITVEDTNGKTVLWDASADGGEGAEVEVDIEAGDSVFLKETRWISKFLSERKEGDRIKLVYTGTKKSAVKGRKATFTYDTTVL